LRQENTDRIFELLGSRDLLLALQVDVAAVAKVAAAMVEQREISPFDWTDLRIAAGRVKVLCDLTQAAAQIGRARDHAHG
jgi:hypothetical protein